MFELDFDIRTHNHGKMNFAAELCRKLGVSKIIDKYTEKSNGRKPDISYGTLAVMMLVNLFDEHKPLYLMKEYFGEHEKDLEGIFKENIDISKINDDRFAKFLDELYEANPRKIFSQISVSALAEYGITINTVNFDTTSKVMWGEYETIDGKSGAISIDFGHSKNKRSDKKQLKMGIGTANGIVVDAIVLSGNMDDKTYNYHNIDDVDELLNRTNTAKDSFYYIADSAFFTDKNIKKALEKRINFISRIPETTNLSKLLITKSLDNEQSMKDVTYINAQNKEIKYKIVEYTEKYNDTPCKIAICYSESLKKTKTNTINKKVAKEYDGIIKISKKYSKRTFACKVDAEREIKSTLNKHFNKIKYYEISYEIEKKIKNPVGRPSKNRKELVEEYVIKLEIYKDDEKIERSIKKGCTFVLASSDINISGEKILVEYKTQSSVETKFKQLKSPNFVNSLFLKTPKRIEALTYMILTALMILSVMESVVRKGIEGDNEEIIGPGNIKMKRPTLRSILRIMKDISYNLIITKDMKKYRKLTKPLKDNQSRILKYLKMDTGLSLE